MSEQRPMLSEEWSTKPLGECLRLRRAKYLSLTGNL